MRFRDLVENKETLTLVDLSFKKDELKPVMSEDSVYFHYNILSKGYVDRFNAGEGDKTYNRAGALLHNVWWNMLQPPKSTNNPKGVSLEFIENKFKSFDDFKDQFTETALSLQGSGWCYLSKSGDVKLIHNHKWYNDIILLIDMWEHSFYYDYGPDKKKYIKDFWKIVDWNIINTRLNFSA